MNVEGVWWPLQLREFSSVHSRARIKKKNFMKADQSCVKRFLEVHNNKCGLESVLHCKVRRMIEVTTRGLLNERRRDLVGDCCRVALRFFRTHFVVVPKSTIL